MDTFRKKHNVTSMWGGIDGIDIETVFMSKFPHELIIELGFGGGWGAKKYYVPFTGDIKKDIATFWNEMEPLLKPSNYRNSILLYVEDHMPEHELVTRRHKLYIDLIQSGGLTFVGKT